MLKMNPKERKADHIKTLKDHFIKLKFFQNVIKDNENEEEIVNSCCKCLKFREYKYDDLIC